VTVATGLDRVGSEGLLRSGMKVGLLAHAASVNRELVHATEVLAGLGLKLRVLFGPEHGFAGTAQDMIGVQGDAKVRSLYGKWPSDLHPQPDDLEGLDAVIVDLQDVGSRYYTYVWTAAFMLRACARLGVKTIVLDRPNPLGGEVVEGMPQRGGYRSFVGCYEVAVRHGMTLGEMLSHVRRFEKLDEAALEIVPMRGWSRAMWFDETGLPWVMPSPNMPTLETATVYPGGCLVEGTRLSEGRGTTRPFELWGAPGIDPAVLPEVEGARLRRVAFQPTFQKHAGEVCEGVQVHVTDRERFRSYQAYLRWIAAAVRTWDVAIPWRTEEYEYETKRAAIDLLTGGPEFRQRVNAGDDLEEYLARDAAGAAEFAASRQLSY